MKRLQSEQPMMQPKDVRPARADWTRRGLLVAAVLVAASTLLSASALVAKGKKPEDVYKGKIILADRPFPPRFRSDEAFISHMKKVNQNEFWRESEEGPWKIEYMAFFARPLENRTYSVLFFDVTDKSKPTLLLEGSSFPERGGLRIMSGYFELKPPHFEANKHYLMLYSASASEPALAETEFVLRPYDPDRAAASKAKREEAARAALEAEGKDKPKDEKETPKWEPPNW